MAFATPKCASAAPLTSLSNAMGSVLGCAHSFICRQTQLSTVGPHFIKPSFLWSANRSGAMDPPKQRNVWEPFCFHPADMSKVNNN